MGEEQRDSAGLAFVDPHQMSAGIYIASQAELEEHGLSREQVLLHELLHVKFSVLSLIPPTEPVGHTLAVENLVNSLTRTLLPKEPPR